MLTGWEIETQPLTKEELEVASHLGNCFNKHFVGKQNSRTGKQICDFYKSQGYKMTGARVRKIINHLRTTSVVPLLLASSKGYYRSTDPEDALRFIRSLTERMEAISNVRSSVKKQLTNLGTNQIPYK